MVIVICPGVHEYSLTQSFLTSLENSLLSFRSRGITPANLLVFPADRVPGYSGLHILQFVSERLSAIAPANSRQVPLVFIGFSAGVVGAIAAAWGWQAQGGTVRAFFALDGWGVPLGGNFPIHRLSHDYFTHWSAALLGAGEDSFYAEPAVSHLELWVSPATAIGYQISPTSGQPAVKTTALNFLVTRLQRYIP